MKSTVQEAKTYEKESKVPSRQSSKSALSILIEGSFNQQLLFLLKLEDTIFDGSSNNESVDRDGALLSNAVRTIDGLELDVGVVEGI